MGTFDLLLLTLDTMGPIDTAKRLLKPGGNDQLRGKRGEPGASSTLPPAGKQGPPDPHFQGPGGPEFPANGGSADYERVGMQAAGRPAQVGAGAESQQK